MPLFNMQPGKRRLFRLRTILLVVMLGILLLPLGSLYFFRFYENELVRKTEIELIAQSAVLAATFREFIGKNAHPFNLDAYDGEYYTPVQPSLDLSVQPVLPRRPSAYTTGTIASPGDSNAGQRMQDIIMNSQRVTLSGIRILDKQGIVIAGRSELGRSLTHVKEVKMALATGKYTAVIRERISNEPPPSIASISRGTGIRVFTAFPIVNEGEVLGLVYLSRTPQNILKHLYQIRGRVITLSLLLLGVTLGIVLFISFHLARPIRQLIEQTQKVARGEQQTVEIINHPGTYELAKLSESFAKMSETTHKRSDYIRQFATHVSHEFKTPITAMQGALELLQEHIDDMPREKQKKFLDNLLADTERMKKLVERLLDLARADSLQPSNESSDLFDVLSRLKTRYQERHLLIEFNDIPESADNKVLMADDALESVFVNLFENSLQHGADRIDVNIQLNDETVSVSVHDNGSGISAANREQIFTPFFTTNRAEGGTGLGLDIVRSLLDNWGGSIELGDSSSLPSVGKPRSGTTFLISIKRIKGGI